MKLYYTPATISVAVAIAAHEVGQAFEPVKVDFAKGEQTGASYRQVNPKARVPSLVVDQGILTETGAMLEFVAPGLVPDDPWTAAQMRAVMYYLASTMHVNHAHRMRGTRWASDPASHADMAANVPRTMAESCRYIEEHALGGPWVLGEAFSLADIYLFVVATWLEGDSVDIRDYPALAAHFEAMKARASVRQAMADGMLPQVSP